MEVKIEVIADHVKATLTGPFSVEETRRAYEAAYSAAFDQGLRLILIDLSGLRGRASATERYTLGKAAVDYWSSKSLIPKIAIIGAFPLVDGLGAIVASSGGVNARTFSTDQEALDWLGVR